MKDEAELVKAALAQTNSNSLAAPRCGATVAGCACAGTGVAGSEREVGQQALGTPEVPQVGVWRTRISTYPPFTVPLGCKG